MNGISADPTSIVQFIESVCIHPSLTKLSVGKFGVQMDDLTKLIEKNKSIQAFHYIPRRITTIYYPRIDPSYPDWRHTPFIDLTVSRYESHDTCRIEKYVNVIIGGGWKINVFSESLSGVDGK